MNRKEQIERVRGIANQGDCNLSCIDCPLHTVDDDHVCGLGSSTVLTRLAAKGWLAENDQTSGMEQE